MSRHAACAPGKQEFASKSLLTDNKHAVATEASTWIEVHQKVNPTRQPVKYANRTAANTAVRGQERTPMFASLPIPPSTASYLALC